MNRGVIFEKMYQEQFSYVYNYIYMKVLHKETAEEICGDVFLKAYEKIETYNYKLAGPRTWLCKIAHNCVVNHFQSSAVKKTVLTDEVEETAVEDDYTASAMPINREVERLLDKLNDEEKEIISLRYGMDISVKELAEMKGVSPNAMTHRITRILEKCRKIEEDSGNKFSDFF